MPQIVCFVLYPILLGSSFFPDFAGATNSWVYPSEYAYRDDSATRAESTSANCRRYPPRDGDEGVAYIHCDGQQLKLSDSDRGSNTEYTATSYYVWSAGSDGQLLFILSERVSLTTITLHYYSDSVRGRPRLKFYAVPDDFDVWDALPSGNRYPYEDIASVPPDGEPAGRRSVSIDINFNTNRILMYKYSSSFQFAVSEVEFFRCIPVTKSVTTTPSVISMTTAIKNDHASTKMKDATIISNTTMEQDAKTSQATTARSQTRGALQPAAMVAVGVVGALLLILVTSLIIILSLIVWHHKRRTHKLEIDPDSGSMRKDASYSILERGTRQHVQPQDLNSTKLYDQIHLSPSTGQTVLISKTESEIAKGINTITPNVYSSVNTENFQSISDSEESKVEDATYAVVDKKKKKKKSKATSDDNGNQKEKREEEVKVQKQPSLEEMYAVVQKKPKKSEEQGETPPPIPASTVESLYVYTAVQRTLQ